MSSVDSDRRRQLPAVDRVLADPRLRPLLSLYGSTALTTQVRDLLAALRLEIESGRLDEATLIQRLGSLPDELETTLAVRFGPPLRRVLNASGIFLHTNLGRTPLPVEVAEGLSALSTAACDLEIDLSTGRRGERSGRLEALLTALSGAEAARVTNNSAAALVLALHVLADGRDVIVSRGEQVEIGGSFRIPDILAAAGARVIEVGTTNRTRLADYEGAIGPTTAVLLKVHASNFRISGFVESVEAPALADLSRRHGLVLIADEGAGLLRRHAAPAFAGHPSMSELLASGCDLVIGSGDKLLGGPQSGLLLGRRELVERCGRHPLYRALRPGRLVTAALDGVLRRQLAGRPLPVERLWSEPEALRRRLVSLSLRLNAEILPAPAFVGGGAAPEVPIAGEALALPADEAFVARLRRGALDPSPLPPVPPVPSIPPIPPVIGALREGKFWLDLRTIDPLDDEVLALAVERARDLPGPED